MLVLAGDPRVGELRERLEAEYGPTAQQFPNWGSLGQKQL